MYHLISIEYSPHGYLNSSLGKNLRWYSPIDVWLTITLKALVQSEFECLKYLSHGPSLAIEDSIEFELSSGSSRKWCPLSSDA